MVNKVSKTKIVTEFLLRLGLSSEEATIYLTLVKNGPLTPLKLSRIAKINRTKVYRLLEHLEHMQIVEHMVEEHTQLAKAADTHQLELLMKQEEAKVDFLQKVFPSVAPLLHGKNETAEGETKVVFYRGKEGIQQMVWNTLRNENGCVGYTYRMLDEITGKRFADFWVKEWVAKGHIFRDIYSDAYRASKAKAKAEEPTSLHSSYFHSRYIPAEVLNISYQTDIYNDVVSYYNWYEGEVFGVEIYNQKIADTQRQLFEIVWNIAKPLG